MIQRLIMMISGCAFLLILLVSLVLVLRKQIMTSAKSCA